MSGFTAQYLSSHSLRKQVVAADLCQWVPVCAIARVTRVMDGANRGSRKL